MKKSITLLLAILLVFCILQTSTGCFAGNMGFTPPGPADDSGEIEPARNPAQNMEGPDGEPSADITLEQGREFNCFYWAFSDAEQDFTSLILSFGTSEFDDPYESHDFMMAYDSLGRCNTYLDALSTFDEFFYSDDIPPGETHLLDWMIMLNVEGSKHTNGNIITASIDDILGEDSRWLEAGAEAGDHACLEASLDTEDLTLNCKSTLDRDGEVVDRTEFEVVILPGGTMLFMFFHVENLYKDDSFARQYAVFKRISGDSYSGVVCGEPHSGVVADSGPDFGFTYDPIIGKGDMTAEQMAQGYTVTDVFTVEGRHTKGEIITGEVSYEKK